MTYEQIAHLLEKYWDGDTTLDEERALKNYFAQDAIDGRLRQHAPLFSALRAEQTVEYQRDGAIRVKMYATTSWHRWAAAAAVVGVLATAAWWALGRPAQTDISPVANVQPVAPAAPATPTAVAPSAAAPEKWVQNTPRPVKRAPNKSHQPLPASAAQNNAEAERAMEEIKAALALVSSKINKGKREAAKPLHQIETVDKILKSPSEG